MKKATKKSNKNVIENKVAEIKTCVMNGKESEKELVFKQSRWVKVHEQQQEFESKDNVMDISIEENGYRAEITYKTTLIRNFDKAAYWFLRSLTNAKADLVAQLATNELNNQIANASKKTQEIIASGNGWKCTIKNVGEGAFKATMNWTVESTYQMKNNDMPLSSKEIEVA